MKIKTTKHVVAALIGAGMTLPSMATVVLNWDHANNLDTGIADIPLAVGAGNDTTDGSLNYRNFTPGSAIMSNTVGSDYVGQDIYAIIQTSSDQGSSVDLGDAGQQIDYNQPAHAQNGTLWLGTKGLAGETANAALVWFQDFDSPVGASDTLSGMELVANNIANLTLRFAVQSNGSWYVSSDSISSAGTLPLLSPNWAILTTATSGSTSLMTAPGSFAPETLDNITAVGYFQEGSASGTTRSRVKLDSLTASVIPEPTTGLLGLLGAVSLLRRRRR